MVSSIDTFAVKERIVAIIKNDTTNLYSATPSNYTKFRQVTAGAPDYDKIVRGPFPLLYVTNQINQIDKIRRLGTQSTASSKTTPKQHEHQLYLEIIFFVGQKDSPDAEEQADDFVYKIINKLEDDTKLSDPDNQGTDFKADDIIVDSVVPYNLKSRGRPITGRRILFRVIKVTA